MRSPTLTAKVAQLRGLLARIVEQYSPAVFATSYSAEDMVLLHVIAGGFPSIDIVTLDTGRLHEETYDLMRRASEKYNRKASLYFPRHEAVQNYVRVNGINGFYESVAQRKECCYVRKVEPLGRALVGKKAWITGLRRGQATGRQRLTEFGYDSEHHLYKFNPLVDWAESEVWNFIRLHGVPYNALHDKGFPSIGCAPCTRAVEIGEDLRSGRWWWEITHDKECGLHNQRNNERETKECEQPRWPD